MSWQQPEKVPVTFRDVAACFSEDEWKLLHEWQKELYTNLMKEIHQALISLGPVIATSVFSLRAKENKDNSLVDAKDSERRRSDNTQSGAIANSALSLRIKAEGHQHRKDPLKTNARESSEHLSTGCEVVHPDTLVRASKGDQAYILDRPQPEQRTDMNESTSYRSPAIHPDILLQIPQKEDLRCRDLSGSEESALRFPLVNEDICWRKERESNPCLIDHPGAEGGECGTDINSGHEVISFIIKDEESYSLDHCGFDSRENIGRPTGDGGLNMQRIHEDSIQYSEKTPACKVSSRQASMNVPQSFKTEASPKSQLRSESNWELGGQKSFSCQRGVSNPAHVNSHIGNPNVGTAETSNKCRSNLRTATCLPSTTQNQTLYTCTECERSFCQKGELIRHNRTHKGVRSYPCTECKKSFFQKGTLTRHMRTHTGEKPFACTDCQKSFSRKGNLNEHRILMHSAVRPYKCTKCVKSFSRQSLFDKHRRTHTEKFLKSKQSNTRNKSMCPS